MFRDVQRRRSSIFSSHLHGVLCESQPSLEHTLASGIVGAAPGRFRVIWRCRSGDEKRAQNGAAGKSIGVEGARD